MEKLDSFARVSLIWGVMYWLLLLFSCLVMSNSFLTLWAVCSPPGSVQGISQARKMEWVAISFSRGSSWSGDETCISCTGTWVLYHWVTRCWWLNINPTFQFHYFVCSTDFLCSLVLRDQFCWRSVCFQVVSFPEVWCEEIDLFLSFLLWNDTTELIILYYLYLFLCFIDLVPKISWSPFCFLLFSCGKLF